MLNQQREGKPIPLWQIVFLVVILVWALIGIGNKNATLTREYDITVEKARKTLQERDSRINGLETSEDKLNKENKQLKKKLESKRKSTLVQSVPVNRQQVVNEIYRVWGKYADTAIYLLSNCENGSLDPRSYNPADWDGTWDAGVFQVNQVHGYTPEYWFNYERNISYAFSLFQSDRGWGHWPYCSQTLKLSGHQTI